MEFNKNEVIGILDNAISISSYTNLSLAHDNPELDELDITDVNQCQSYIGRILDKNDARVAYGGYLEKRNLYKDISNFSDKQNQRNIHLGIDFWTSAGTKVITPLDGNVHSFKNNFEIGDYGPTIILQHNYNDIEFYTLYGHLSLSSLKNLYVGKPYRKGEVMAYLGTSDINVNYAPHLHFQIILDMEGKAGDYPGVCSENMLAFYAQNCPNPNLLLHMKQ